jgi:hypothetical protein
MQKPLMLVLPQAHRVVIVGEPAGLRFVPQDWGAAKGRGPLTPAPSNLLQHHHHHHQSSTVHAAARRYDNEAINCQ